MVSIVQVNMLAFQQSTYFAKRQQGLDISSYLTITTAISYADQLGLLDKIMKDVSSSSKVLTTIWEMDEIGLRCQWIGLLWC